MTDLRKRRFSFPRNLPLLIFTLLLAALALWALVQNRFFVASTGKIERKRLAVYLAAALGPVLLSQVDIRLPKRGNIVWRALYMALGIVLAALAFQSVTWEWPLIGEWRFRFVALGITAVFLTVFWVLLRDVRHAVPVGYGVLVVLGYAYRCVFTFRGAVVSPADLLTLTTALRVASGYRYTFISNDWMFACLTGLLLAVGTWLPHERPRGLGVRLGKAMCVCACGAWMGCLLFTSLLTDLGADLTGFKDYAPWLNRGQGGMTTFMLEWHNLLASRPGNLTPQALGELEGQLEAAPLSQEEATQRPHIIVIVNESFCDPQQLGIETSEDPLPFLHSLESCIRGNVYVSAFGGSTGNTEHSFLTATIPPPMLTMPLLSTVRETTPSLASYLRGLGYTTLAMHPSAPENYQRDMVYPLLGFDRFIDRSGFQNPERIRELITDRSCYEKLVELYENRLPGERLFAYIMTIQNHGGYLIGGVPGEISVSGAENLGWEEHAEQEEYVRLLRQSDEAMEELIGYFSRQTEPVVLLFFGDHQPMLRGLSDERPSQTEAQRFFRDQWTPFWIWSNGSLEQMDGCEVSVNYLSSLLLKAAGLPLSTYDAWLLKQSETYPIVLQMGYADAQGSEGKWSADGLWPKTLQQLNLARYNRLGRACDRLPGLATGE